MTLDDFTDLLDRCGGDASDWPHGAAAGADRLLATSEAARARLAAQRRLDQILAETSAPDTAADFATLAMRGPQPAAAGVARPARWAAAAAVALTLGVAAGAVRGGFEDPGATVAAALGGAGEGADAG